MSKHIQAILTGMLITFFLDFFLFLGIKESYIDVHKIDLYYNILFADNQNIYIFSFFTIILGYLATFNKNTKVNLIILGTLFFLTFLTLIKPIGNYCAEIVLMEKNVTFKNNKYTFRGDIYYNGRKKITFYDYELKKIILLDKKELIQ